MDHTALNPAILKPGLTTPDGLNLKPGLVTSAYTGGTPSASNQIKPSLRNADGTLKAGLISGSALKAGLLNSLGPPPNYYAQFNGTTDEAAIPAITHTAAAGTLMVRCKLNVATPATLATSGLFAWSSAGFGNHYPYTTGQAYETCFRTTRVGPFALSGSVTRTAWHWVIVRANAASGWEYLQALDNGTLYSLSTAANEAWATSPADRLIGKQKNAYRLAGGIDRLLIGDSRWSDAQIQAVIAGGNGPADVLVRYEFSSNAGGVFADESGNGKHATISGSPVITAF